MVLSRKLKKKIENAFFSYIEYKTQKFDAAYEFAVSNGAINYDRLSIMASSKPDYYLEKQFDKQILMQKWVSVVDRTLEYFNGTGKDTLIKMRYFEKKSLFNQMDRLIIDKSTLYDYINDIVTYAAFLAIQECLISF